MKPLEFAHDSERVFADLIQNRFGYQVEWIGRQSHECDVRITNPRTRKVVTVNVKASRLTRHSRRLMTRRYGEGYQFLIYKVNHSIFIREDFVALRCCNEVDTWYIIPTEKISAVNNITIPRADATLYRGKYAIYRENFDLIVRDLE